MLQRATVPAGLWEMLGACRAVFTAPTFLTFGLLVTGALGAVEPRTVTGMWAAAGMAGRAHWSRAHRFFSHARWDPDALGLALTRLVVAAFTADGQALTVAVDDTLFHRYGRSVFGAAWQHDGSAKGRDGIGRGNCFVIAGLVVTVPFTDRNVCLPLLLRLHLPGTSASGERQARELVGGRPRRSPTGGCMWSPMPPTRARPGGTCPASVTFTTRLASNAVLHAPAPPRTGRRETALKGPRLGTPTELAATATWTPLRGDPLPAPRHHAGRGDHVFVVRQPALHPGAGRTGPRPRQRQALRHRPGQHRPVRATPAQLIARYADRWSIEQAIKDGKDPLGVGEAHNRLQAAVERTVPFGMLTLTILTCWYHQAGPPSGTSTPAARSRPGTDTERNVAVIDMLAAFRRARITAITALARSQPA